ncbi:TOPK kinase, partial [Vidua chalybeata]|nr:TOPK kinase [Vidua chalybeata]
EPGPVSVTIPASPFMQKLGFGTGVSVYLMKRSPRGLSRSPWAVKKINSGCSRSQRSLFQRRLREEAQTLRNLRHPNIVGGWESAGNGGAGSIGNGEIGSVGNGGGLDPLGMERLDPLGNGGAGICWGGRGLDPTGMAEIGSYLHTEQRLLHGDIKSPNVVVRGAFEAVKICDVGVSLPLDENLTVADGSLRYVGTEPWLPPEALPPPGAISDRADVFAFGLTLWEMLALSVPHL